MIKRTLAFFFWATFSLSSAFAQGSISLEYCYGGGCGLQGNDAAVASVPPNLYLADLAARQYGAQASQFVQTIQTAKQEFEELRQVVDDLSGTPFSFDNSELNAQVSAFFDNPNLIPNLENVYSAPLEQPISLPPSAAAQLDNLWATLEGGQPRDLVEAAARVRHISRYARNLADIGGQIEAASYLRGELRRNFTDQNGLISFLGNHDQFKDVFVGSSQNVQLDGRIVDGINSVIIADFILTTVGSSEQLERAKPGLGALASAYGAASSLALIDESKATDVLTSLDFAGKLTAAFVDGFLSQGLETVEAFVTMLENPAATLDALYTAIVNIDDTAALIVESVEAKYDDFIAGDAVVRAEILGEVAFEVGGVFLGGAGTIKYGSNAIKATNEAATLAVKREFARFARVQKVGSVGADATEALRFAERVNPDAALRLYELAPAHAADVGRQMRTFMGSKSERGILGEEFLRLNPESVSFYTDDLPAILSDLNSGNSITVYSKFPNFRSQAARDGWVDEWTKNGLKGPNTKKWMQTETNPLTDRFGVGRYASFDPETPFFEVPNDPTKKIGSLLFESQFKNLPNDGNGYIFFPSTKNPGGINVFDPAFDDYGAFFDVKLIDEVPWGQ